MNAGGIQCRLQFALAPSQFIVKFSAAFPPAGSGGFSVLTRKISTRESF
jgi:hypothetical protein